MFSRRKNRFFMSTTLIILLIFISLIQSFAESSSPTPFSSPYPTGVYDMECYIKPDLTENAPAALENFEITLESNGTTFEGKTDQSGYLKLLRVYTIPWNVTISKPGFLTRTYNNRTSTVLGTLKEPISMWAGDVNQDNIINMIDVIEIAKSFGKTSDETGFNTAADFNCDKTINMSDVIIVCKHFNKTSADYSTDTSENTYIILNIIYDNNAQENGAVDISAVPSDSTENLYHRYRYDSNRTLKISFPKGTQVTLKALTWPDVEYSCNINGITSSENPLIFNVQGGEEITYSFYVNNPTPTPTTPPGQTPTPTSPYPIFHCLPYNVTTNLVTSDISNDKANISLDMNVTHRAYINAVQLVYWKKNNPDDKITKLIATEYVNKNISETYFITSNFQLTGLEPNTTYCCQIETDITPYGEIQTRSYEYYWTVGPNRPYTSSIYELSTLP